MFVVRAPSLALWFSASECKDKVVSFSNLGYSCAHYMGTHISRTQYGYNPPWCNGTTVNDTRFQKDNKAGVALNGEGADGACCGCGGGIQVEPTTNAPVTEAPLTAGEGIQVTGTSTATPSASAHTPGMSFVWDACASKLLLHCATYT